MENRTLAGILKEEKQTPEDDFDLSDLDDPTPDPHWIKTPPEGIDGHEMGEKLKLAVEAENVQKKLEHTKDILKTLKNVAKDVNIELIDLTEYPTILVSLNDIDGLADKALDFVKSTKEGTKLDAFMLNDFSTQLQNATGELNDIDGWIQKQTKTMEIKKTWKNIAKEPEVKVPESPKKPAAQKKLKLDTRQPQAIQAEKPPTKVEVARRKAEIIIEKNKKQEQREHDKKYAIAFKELTNLLEQLRVDQSGDLLITAMEAIEQGANPTELAHTIQGLQVIHGKKYAPTLSEMLGPNPTIQFKQLTKLFEKQQILQSGELLTTALEAIKKGIDINIIATRVKGLQETHGDTYVPTLVEIIEANQLLTESKKLEKLFAQNNIAESYDLTIHAADAIEKGTSAEVILANIQQLQESNGTDYIPTTSEMIGTKKVRTVKNEQRQEAKNIKREQAKRKQAEIKQTKILTAQTQAQATKEKKGGIFGWMRRKKATIGRVLLSAALMVGLKGDTSEPETPYGHKAVATDSQGSNITPAIPETGKRIVHTDAGLEISVGEAKPEVIQHETMTPKERAAAKKAQETKASPEEVPTVKTVEAPVQPLNVEMEDEESILDLSAEAELLPETETPKQTPPPLPKESPTLKTAGAEEIPTAKEALQEIQAELENAQEQEEPVDVDNLPDYTDDAEEDTTQQQPTPKAEKKASKTEAEEATKDGYTETAKYGDSAITLLKKLLKNPKLKADFIKWTKKDHPERKGRSETELIHAGMIDLLLAQGVVIPKDGSPWENQPTVSVGDILTLTFDGPKGAQFKLEKAI
jgi:hypothetical protein